MAEKNIRITEKVIGDTLYIIESAVIGTAKMAKEAFHLCMQGYGPTQIAKEFSKRRIMNPNAHAKANGVGIPDNRGRRGAIRLFI